MHHFVTKFAFEHFIFCRGREQALIWVLDISKHARLITVSASWKRNQFGNIKKKEKYFYPSNVQEHFESRLMLCFYFLFFHFLFLIYHYFTFFFRTSIGSILLPHFIFRYNNFFFFTFQFLPRIVGSGRKWKTEKWIDAETVACFPIILCCYRVSKPVQIWHSFERHFSSCLGGFRIPGEQ